MKKFKHLIFSFVLLVGMSMAVSAQRTNDPKKPPPKDPPPKVNPGGEKPPPKEGNRPKKPGSEFSIIWRDEQKYLV